MLEDKDYGLKSNCQIVKLSKIMIKKLLIIAVMVFACGTSYAQKHDFFQGNSVIRGTSGGSGDNPGYPTTPTTPVTPGHGGDDDVTPIGDGIVLLMGLGAAYMLKNRKKNE